MSHSIERLNTILMQIAPESPPQSRAMERLNTLITQLAPSSVAGAENPLQIQFIPGEKKRYYVDWSSTRSGEVDKYGSKKDGLHQKVEGFITFHVDKVDQAGRGILRYSIDTAKIKSSGKLEVSPFGRIEKVYGQTTPPALFLLKRVLHARPETTSKALVGWGVEKPECCQVDQLYKLKEYLAPDGKFYLSKPEEGTTKLQNSGWVAVSTEKRSKKYTQTYKDINDIQRHTVATHTHNLQIQQDPRTAKELGLKFTKGETRHYKVAETHKLRDKKIVPVMAGLKTVGSKLEVQESVSKTLFEIVLLVKKVLVNGKALFTFTQKNIREERDGNIQTHPNVTGKFVVDAQGRVSEFSSSEKTNALFAIKKIFMQRPTSELQKVKGWPSGNPSVRHYRENSEGAVVYQAENPKIVRRENDLTTETSETIAGRFDLSSDMWVATHQEREEKRVTNKNLLNQFVGQEMHTVKELSIEQTKR